MTAPTRVGFSGTNSASLATTADIPAGQAIFIVGGDWTGTNTDFSSGISFSDGGINTYTFVAQSRASGAATAFIFKCDSGAFVPSGTTVSVSGISGIQFYIAYAPYGGGLDQTAGVASSSSVTSLDVAVPTLAGANGLIIGVGNNSNNMIGVTEANGYAQIQSNSGPERWLDFAYLVASSTTPPDYNPNGYTSGACSALVCVFKATSGGGGFFSRVYYDTLGGPN